MIEKRQKLGWVFVSPFIIGQILFTLIPLVCAIYFAFVKYDFFTTPKWVGLDNFKYWLFEDKNMWIALRNTFTYAFIQVPLGIVVACAIACLLNTKIKSIGVFRTIYYIPVLTPAMAVSMIWLLMYNPAVGYLNDILGIVGIGPYDFVFSSNWFEVIVSICIMNVWKGVGYTSIYLFTAMQAISEDVNEAAAVDGATGLTKFFKITLPLITPTIFFLMIIQLSGAMQEFDSFFIMSAATSGSTDVLGTLLYSKAWGELKIGEAAALSWISFIIILSFTMVQKAMEKRWVFYG